MHFPTRYSMMASGTLKSSLVVNIVILPSSVAHIDEDKQLVRISHPQPAEMLYASTVRPGIPNYSWFAPEFITQAMYAASLREVELELVRILKLHFAAYEEPHAASQAERLAAEIIAAAVAVESALV